MSGAPSVSRSTHLSNTEAEHETPTEPGLQKEEGDLSLRPKLQQPLACWISVLVWKQNLPPALSTAELPLLVVKLLSTAHPFHRGRNSLYSLTHNISRPFTFLSGENCPA